MEKLILELKEYGLDFKVLNNILKVKDYDIYIMEKFNGYQIDVSDWSFHLNKNEIKQIPLIMEKIDIYGYNF